MKLASAQAIARTAFRLVSLPVRAGITLGVLWALEPILRADVIPCRVCGNELSLLGLWECSRCGFAAFGHYWAPCENCGVMPSYLDCLQCGASTRNPLYLT